MEKQEASLLIFLRRKGMTLIKTGGELKLKINPKTTDEIRTLLSNAKLDFDLVECRAMNDYLPRFFRSHTLERICAQQNNELNVQFSINYANEQSWSSENIEKM